MKPSNTTQSLKTLIQFYYFYHKLQFLTHNCGFFLYYILGKYLGSFLGFLIRSNKSDISYFKIKSHLFF